MEFVIAEMNLYFQTSVVFENLKLAEIFIFFHVVLLKSRCRKPIKYQLQLLIRLIKSDMVISFMLVIDFCSATRRETCIVI